MYYPRLELSLLHLPFILKLHPCQLHDLVSMVTDRNIYEANPRRPKSQQRRFPLSLICKVNKALIMTKLHMN